MNTVLNIKLDPELKKRAQEVARELGIPMSVVVAGQLREFVRTRTLIISDPPKLKPEVEKELLRISQDAHEGKNISPGFKNLDEAFAWLDKQ